MSDPYQSSVEFLMSTDPDKRLTKTQQLAVELLLALGDPKKVDAVLELEPGTTARWSTILDFEKRKARLAYEEIPEVDYAKVVDPKHAEAARHKVFDHLTQKEIGEKLRVTPRTVRDWFKRPEVARYMEQLSEQKAREDEEERRARESEVESILQGGRVVAATQLVAKAEEGDLRAIELVLRSARR
jgi:hypothetical protein